MAAYCSNGQWAGDREGVEMSRAFKKLFGFGKKKEKMNKKIKKDISFFTIIDISKSTY